MSAALFARGRGAAAASASIGKKPSSSTTAPTATATRHHLISRRAESSLHRESLAHARRKEKEIGDADDWRRSLERHPFPCRPPLAVPRSLPLSRAATMEDHAGASAAAAAAAASSPSDPSSSSTDRPRSSARARAIAPPAIGRSSVDVIGGVALSDFPSSSSSSSSSAPLFADSPSPPSTPLSCPDNFSPPQPAPGFDSIPSALLAVARGEFVVVLDDADRENEGDLILAADAATTSKIAFMVEETSGVLCVGLPGPTCDRLALPLMVPPAHNEDAMRTAFTVTVDATEGISTGISAADRARTIRLLARGTQNGDVDVEPEASTSSSSFSSTTVPSDLRRPGHIFPLRAHPGGVRSRPGHTEAAVDLSRLAGRRPAGLLCEIVDRTAKDGSMARTPRLLAFSQEANLKCITIADLVAFMDARDAAIAREEGGKA